MFCAQIDCNLTPKGARIATFCENEGRTRDSQRDAAALTNYRLDKLGTCVGAELTPSRVAATG